MAVSNVRMPDEVYQRLRDWAKAENRSINELTVEILDRETRRWVALQALARADQLRDRLYARYGQFPDSAEEIREMREERSNRG